MTQCERCGKEGGGFEVRKYNLPNKLDMVLCKSCYQEVIKTREYLDQYRPPQVPKCPSCKNPVSSEYKICPYCGKKINKDKLTS